MDGLVRTQFPHAQPGRARSRLRDRRKPPGSAPQNPARNCRAKTSARACSWPCCCSTNSCEGCLDEREAEEREGERDAEVEHARARMCGIAPPSLLRRAGRRAWRAARRGRRPRLTSFGLALGSSSTGAPRLDVNLGLRLRRDLARVTARGLVKLGQPVLTEPSDRLGPTELVGDDRLVPELALSRVDAEPAVHCEHFDSKRVELELNTQQHAEQVAKVGKAHNQPERDRQLAVHGREAHADNGAVELRPEERVTVRVRVGVTVRDDVELAERGGAGAERALGDDEAVRVIVHMREADAVEAAPEDAQFACARHLEQVWQEEVVAWPVHLMRRDRARHEVVACSRAQRHLAARLGARVLLQVGGLRQLGHLRLGEPVHILAVKTGRRRGGHDDLAAADGLARLDHVQRPRVIHVLVQLRRVVRPDGRAVVPNALGARHRAQHRVIVAQVTLHVLDGGVRPAIGGLWRHVE
mmetsp:Transcript_5576/g.17507  ORF Transcript_5576/g.17507 Transcript_5576/m.17507 type:complete len:470 (-) Transcript_5576:292-1701(-)